MKKYWLCALALVFVGAIGCSGSADKDKAEPKDQTANSAKADSGDKGTETDQATTDQAKAGEPAQSDSEQGPAPLLRTTRVRLTWATMLS